jgi:hypothetical protein
VAAARIELSAPHVGTVGTFEMPALTVHPGTGIELKDLEGSLVVTDEEAVRFKRITRQMLHDPTVAFHCAASLDVSFNILFVPMSFSGLDFHHNVVVPSMAGLTASLKLEGFSLARSTASLLAIDGNVSFYNPSPVAVHIGDLVLTYAYQASPPPPLPFAR